MADIKKERSPWAWIPTYG